MSAAERSEPQRLARNFSELLQELRVAQAGVQILFGFLLSIAFTERYARVSDGVRLTHLLTVLFAAAAVALLTAPAAWHRILFRRGRREEILAMANRFAISGLLCLAFAMTGTVIVLVEVIVGGWATIVLGVAAFVVFGVLWFAWPLQQRLTDRGDDSDDSGPGDSDQADSDRSDSDDEVSTLTVGDQLKVS